jgi:hypothetical protein
MFGHILRLWLLVSLATLLAGLLLAPRPVRADDRHNRAGLAASEVWDGGQREVERLLLRLETATWLSNDAELPEHAEDPAVRLQRHGIGRLGRGPAMRGRRHDDWPGLVAGSRNCMAKMRARYDASSPA